MHAGRTECTRRTRALLEPDNFNDVFEEYSQGAFKIRSMNIGPNFLTSRRLLLGHETIARREKTAKPGISIRPKACSRKFAIFNRWVHSEFHGGRAADTKDLAAFLYKINSSRACKEVGGSFSDDSSESRYLSHKFVDFGFDWGGSSRFYRWALQPDNLSEVLIHFAQPQIRGGPNSSWRGLPDQRRSLNLDVESPLSHGERRFRSLCKLCIATQRPGRNPKSCRST